MSCQDFKLSVLTQRVLRPLYFNRQIPFRLLITPKGLQGSDDYALTDYLSP